MNYLVLIFFLLSSTSFASSNGESSSSKEQQVLQIMKDLNELGEKEIEEVRKLVDKEAQRKYDERRSKTLGRILLNIRSLGKVRIRNCNDLDVVGDSDEVKEFRETLLDYCQQSLRGFWAEIDSDGLLRFNYDTSSSNNSKTVNVGGGGEFTISYRGHELLLRGYINDNEVGKETSQSFKRKLDSRVDYSIDIAIKNLEAFLLWHIDKEDANSIKETDITSSGFQRQILATGLRLELQSEKDLLNLQFGIGGGVSYRDAYGTTSLSYPATWSPSIISTLDFTLKPTKLLSFVSNGRVQRDFHSFNPAWVASQSLGIEFTVRGITLGTRFTVDWDDYRTNAGVDTFGYSGMFTVGINLSDFIAGKNKKEQKEKRLKEKQREVSIWRFANEYADKEEKKVKVKPIRSFIRDLFGF